MPRTFSTPALKHASDTVAYVLLALAFAGALVLARNSGKQEAADAMCRQLGHTYAAWDTDAKHWTCYDRKRWEA